MGALRGHERGASTLEYIGIAIAGALMCGAVFLAFGSAPLSDATGTAICKITTGVGGTCTAPSPGEPGSTPPDYGGMGSTGEDPGAGTQLPSGLDADNPMVKEMMETARGRRILQWLHDNGIEVVIDPGATGAYYSDGKIVLGPGYENSETLAHEANHAQYDKEGRHADVSNPSKETYVREAIAEEANGVWVEVVYNKERRDAGANVPVSAAEARYDTAYQEAYARARASGSTAAQAHGIANQAGKAAIENMFYDGTFRTSTNDKSYPDYYGGYWDSVH